MTPLAALTPADADRLIERARRTLASHAREAQFSPAAGDLDAAVATTLGTLRELAALHPDKRGAIATLLARYAP